MDTHLEGALQVIFDRMTNRKRSSSIPPLPASSKARRIPPVERVSKLPAPRRASSKFPPVTSLHSPLTVERTHATAATPPLRLQVEISSDGPARFHSSFCTMCADKIEVEKKDPLMRFLRHEDTTRTKILECECQCYGALRCEWFAELSAECKRQWEKHRKRATDAYLNMIHEKQRERIFQEQRKGRYELRKESEAEFDGIAAFQTLALRQHNQLNEMRRKTESRRAEQAQQQEQQRIDEEASNPIEGRMKQQRAAFESNESVERERMLGCESSVREAYTNLFTKKHAELRRHEFRVNEMLARHRQRLVSLSSDKDALAQDESSGRERVIAAEKKAREVMYSLDPDSRKRANAAAAARLRREAAQQSEMSDEESAARSTLRTEESNSRSDVVRLAASEHAALLRREARREELRLRGLWREQLEIRESDKMLQEENDCWLGVFREFEQSVDHDVEDKEAAARVELVNLKRVDFQRLSTNNRERLRMCQAERRCRSELSQQWNREDASLVEEILGTGNEFSIEWGESLGRTQITNEMLAEFKQLNSSASHSHKSAIVLTEYPTSRTDRSHSCPNYVLWLRNSSLVWFFGASEVFLLTAASLKTEWGVFVTDVEEMPFEAEVMNPCDGDSLQADFASHVDSKPHHVKGVINGDVARLFESLKFWNEGPVTPEKIISPRAVQVTLDRLSVVIGISVQPPLCTPPQILVSSGKIAPLKDFVAPPPEKFRSVRLQLRIMRSGGRRPSQANSHKLRFVVPSTYGYHPAATSTNSSASHSRASSILAPRMSIAQSKPRTPRGPSGLASGLFVATVSKDGKTVLRIRRSSEDIFDCEFENIPGQSIQPLLKCVTLARGEDLSPVDPLQLTLFLTGTDESLSTTTHLLDVEATDVPRLVVQSSAIRVRATCGEVREKMNDIVPPNPQHVFSTAYITFPENQIDVIGGSMTFSFTEHDGLCSLGISPIGTMNCMLVRGKDLVCTHEGDSLDGEQVLGEVSGVNSHEMIVHFSHSAALTTDMACALLQSITINTNRRGSGQSQGRRVTLQVLMDLNEEDGCETISTLFDISILPPVIELPLRFSSFGYREASGFKRIPSLQSKLGAVQLLPEARLEVQIVSGEEEGDEIDVMEKQLVDEKTQLFCWQHNNVPFAWWHGRALLNAPLVVHLSSEAGIQNWMRSSIEEPYPNENFVAGIISPDASSAVNVFLRCVAYGSTNCGPTKLKKLIRITMDDGHTGRSSLAVAVSIETVDDPTELALGMPELTYRQNSAAAISHGFPLIPSCTMTDPDSDSFHGGYAIIESASAAGEAGDRLYILNAEQQEHFLYAAEGKTSGSWLKFLHDEDLALSNSMDRPYLLTVWDEQPQSLLTIEPNNQCIFAGVEVGTVVYKTSGTKDAPVNSIRFNFSSPEMFVSFPVVEYCIRCVAFENSLPKMKEGPRQFNVRLNASGLKTTVETLEKITVVANRPLFSVSPPNIKYEEKEAGKPKLLCVKTVTTTLNTVVENSGFLRARVARCSDAHDELRIEQTDTIKVKDNMVYSGKDLIGVLVPVSGSPLAALQVNFSKIDGNSLVALLKALAFVNRVPAQMELSERTIVIHCTTTTEADACEATISIAVVRKGGSVSVVLSPSSVVHMSSGTPTAILPHMTIKDAKVLFAGTTVQLIPDARSKIDGTLTAQSTGDVEVHLTATLPSFPPVASAAKAAQQLSRLEFKIGSTVVAFADGALTVGRMIAFHKLALTIETTTELSPDALSLLLETIGYYSPMKAHRGDSHLFTVQLSPKGSPPTKTPLAIDIAHPVLDFSLCPNPVMAFSEARVAIACALRIQLRERSAMFLALSVSIVSGNEPGDALSISPPSDSSISVDREGRAVLHKKAQFGKIVAMTPTNISIRVEPPDSAVVQELARSLCVTITSPVSKIVSIEFTGACNYGQVRQFIRVNVS